jgi:molybdopterin synthase sulfur carrier subunit
MNQEWKLFADLAELAGGREVTVTVEPDATVGDALAALLADRPALADRVRDDDGVADDVNLLYNGTALRGEDLETTLTESDELALFPPVSGG